MAFLREQRRAVGREVVRAGRKIRDVIFGKVALPGFEHPPRRILIIRPFFLGDILLCLPLAQAIRRARPDARISWLLREEWKDLLQGHCVVDEIIPFSSSKMRTVRGLTEFFRVAHELRKRSFDLVLNLAWDRSSTLWSWMSKARVRLGIEEYGRPRLLSLLHTQTVVAAERSKEIRPMADFYYEPLKLLGFPPRTELPEIWATPEENTEVQIRLSSVFQDASAPFLLVHPGGRLRYKRWPAERFAELLERLGPQIPQAMVLVCGPGEEAWASDLASALPPGKGLFWPVPSLGQLMALSQRAALFLGNDSGPMHLAAATGCRVVALFGKDPAPWTPLGDRRRVIIGEAGLPSITVEEVLQPLLEILRT